MEAPATRGNGGPATEATLSGVIHLAVDRARNALYFADIDNNWVRKVDLSTGLLSVYAGEGPDGFGFSGDGGPATGALFAFPEGVAVDASGRLSIADVFNDRIRQVDPVTGIITTIAGTATPTSRRATADPPPPPRSRGVPVSSAPTARAMYSSATKARAPASAASTPSRASSPPSRAAGPTLSALGRPPM